MKLPFVRSTRRLRIFVSYLRSRCDDQPIYISKPHRSLPVQMNSVASKRIKAYEVYFTTSAHPVVFVFRCRNSQISPVSSVSSPCIIVAFLRLLSQHVRFAFARSQSVLMYLVQIRTSYITSLLSGLSPLSYPTPLFQCRNNVHFSWSLFTVRSVELFH